MPAYYEIIYRNSLQALGDFHSQFFLDAVADGDLVSVQFKAEGVTDFTDDWFFGLKLNGADILTGADRPHITALDLTPEVMGLSIPVAKLDRLSPTVDDRALGIINGPVVVILGIEDGTGGGGGGGDFDKIVTSGGEIVVFEGNVVFTT